MKVRIMIGLLILLLIGCKGATAPADQQTANQIEPVVGAPAPAATNTKLPEPVRSEQTVTPSGAVVPVEDDNLEEASEDTSLPEVTEADSETADESGGTGQDIIIGQAAIDTFNVEVVPGASPKVTLVVTGNLPDSCTVIRDFSQRRQEDQFVISIRTERQSDAVCAQALVPFEERILLETGQLPSGTYQLAVNGVRGSFSYESMMPESELAADTRQVTDVAIEAEDGLELAGTFYPGAGSGPRPGVLLLHMLNSNRQVWQSFATDLSLSGYAVLALDMRGHGETGGAKAWQQAEDDLLRAWRYLAQQPDVNGQRTAIIGASIGANMALITGSNEPQIVTVALLSPGLDYQSVSTSEAMRAFRDRPVFIVASQEDQYAASSSEELIELAEHGDSKLLMFSGAGHGTNMFATRPDLSEILLEWLETQLPD